MLRVLKFYPSFETAAWWDFPSTRWAEDRASDVCWTVHADDCWCSACPVRCRREWRQIFVHRSSSSWWTESRTSNEHFAFRSVRLLFDEDFLSHATNFPTELTSIEWSTMMNRRFEVLPIASWLRTDEWLISMVNKINGRLLTIRFEWEEIWMIIIIDRWWNCHDIRIQITTGGNTAIGLCHG